MTITPTGFVFLAAIGLGIALTTGVNRRYAAKGEPMGGFATFYFGLVLTVISILFVMGTAFGAKTIYHMVSLPKYEATIISFDSAMEEVTRTDSDGDSYTTDVMMHTPVLQFTDASGRLITQRGNIASGAEPIIGDTVRIAYQDGELLVISLASIGMLLGLAVMLLILGYIIVRVFYFTRNQKPAWLDVFGTMVFAIVIFGGMLFMLGGMLYGVYQYFFMPEREMPIWALCVCMFFSVIISWTLIAFIVKALQKTRKSG